MGYIDTGLINTRGRLDSNNKLNPPSMRNVNKGNPTSSSVTPNQFNPAKHILTL